MSSTSVAEEQLELQADCVVNKDRRHVFGAFEDIEAQARSFMANNGIHYTGEFRETASTEEIKFAGRDGDRRKLCWLKCNHLTNTNGDTGLCITFGAHHSDLPDKISETFWPNNNTFRSKEEIDAINKRVVERRHQAEERVKEQQRLDDEKAKECGERYLKASKEGSSPYFERKRMPAPKEARYEVIDNFEAEVETIALFALENVEGQIRALQEIYPTKRSFREGEKPRDKNSIGKYSGCFCKFSAKEEIQDGEPIGVCEGIANGVVIFGVKSITTLAAISRVNIRNVVKEIRARYPNSPIFIFGDDDDTKGNPGRTDAEAAAKEFRCVSVFPKFPPGKERDAEGKAYTDFDDLLRICGEEEVRRQVEKAMRPNIEPLQLSEDAQAKAEPVPAINGEPSPNVYSPKSPHKTAKAIVESSYIHNGVRTLHYCSDVFYRWGGTHYQEMHPNGIRQFLYDHLEQAKVIKPIKEGIPDYEDFNPTKSKVDLVIDSLKANAHQNHSPESGAFWLDGKAHPSPRDLICFDNGILDINKYLKGHQGIELIPHTPLLFNTNSLPFEFVESPPKPTQWLEFLKSIWLDDRESIDTLQEWMGYILTQDTRFQKILIMVGPPRCGKGTIARVIDSLLGKRNVVRPTLSSLSTPFGMQPWLNKTLAIISDARLTNKSDHGVISERLLNVSGEDTLTIPRKYRDDITTKLSTRIMMLTNEMPDIRDASGALVNRYIILPMIKSFLGEEDPFLTEKLLTELPGIMVWSLQGLLCLRKRNKLHQPSSAMQHFEEAEAMSSPIKAFIKERCELGPTKEIEVDCLFKHWCKWCEENGCSLGNVHLFGRNLRAAIPHLSTKKLRTKEGRERRYQGIGMAILPNF